MCVHTVHYEILLKKINNEKKSSLFYSKSNKREKTFFFIKKENLPLKVDLGEQDRLISTSAAAQSSIIGSFRFQQ